MSRWQLIKNALSSLVISPGTVMEIELLRFSSGTEDTLGLLLLNGKFQCFVLEDQYQTVKVYGETRIPAGRYRITFCTSGKHHAQYKKKFPKFHRGMLLLGNVPNFQSILIHIGNSNKDTAGCLLVGDTCTTNAPGIGRLTDSTIAYKRIYPVIAEAIERGEVWITIRD